MKVQVGTVSELPPGERKFVAVDGLEIAVLNVEGIYHAIRNFCPHMAGPVGRGLIECDTDDHDGCTVYCPFHSWRFDLETGDAIFPSDSKKIKVYETSVEEAEAESSRASGEQSSKMVPEETLAKTKADPGDRRTFASDEASLETYDVAVEEGVIYIEI